MSERPRLAFGVAKKALPSEKVVPWYAPYMLDEDVNAVAEAVRYSESTVGAYIEKFEREFANYLKCKHGIAVMNGTSALHLGLLASGIKPGDEVIVPSFTFVATVNPVLYAGAKPVFVDIDPKTYNITAEKIKEGISAKTKAIIPVHLMGQSCDMDPIMELAEDHNLAVIEDGAEAHGAEYKGRKVGSIGDVGCFSFSQNKNMTCTQGGMVVTNSDEISEKVGSLRRQSTDPLYWGTHDIFHHTGLGYNYMMTDIQAALGLVQLKRLDHVNQMRKKAADIYGELLSEVEGVEPPFVAPYTTHVYFLYVIRFAEEYVRDEVASYLVANNIHCQITFPPLHLQPFYQTHCKYKEGSLTASEKCGKTVLSLPIYPHIKREDQQFVVEKIHEGLKL